MKSWTKSTEINAPIDHVWSFLNGSLENMQKIMPQVVENKPVKVTKEGVGTVYRQKYKEGNRVMEYDVTTLEHTDTQEYKRLKVGFKLANMFDITAAYELKSLAANRTEFTYTTTNKPLKWFVKLFLLFSSEKVVVEFVERVKKAAEETHRVGV
ncbi:hypothetical protein A8F94_15745 [Bacillus sp. FJAT-27225]|uniref:SRPBCC family protein n=1 Tax=Bacillus sp. FJAT-27225 TaxID=1743144 RepID=UPI00080C220F|nr:SRPBCC family protein [Bacillus sp. FJAT-27225]OCA84173.1 hypothetical protein A8F94_15745 [Bacillus sp. FJAT-27225]